MAIIFIVMRRFHSPRSQDDGLFLLPAFNFHLYNENVKHYKKKITLDFVYSFKLLDIHTTPISEEVFPVLHTSLDISLPVNVFHVLSKFSTTDLSCLCLSCNFPFVSLYLLVWFILYIIVVQLNSIYAHILENKH